MKASNAGLSSWATELAEAEFNHGTFPLAKVPLQSNEINIHVSGGLPHSSFACDALADGRI